MTTKSRPRGGSAKPTPQQSDEQVKATAKAEVDEAAQAAQDQQPDGPGQDNITGEGERPEQDAPENHATDGGNAGGDGLRTEQLAAVAEALPSQGDPVPAKVGKGMVRAETGLSPEPASGPTQTAATDYDPERNGAPTAIGTDRSGDLRHQPAAPTAAHGRTAGNGQAVEMIEDHTTREFGGNGDPTAKLVGSGVRGEQGVGTLDRDLPDDERPDYPSTTLTRSSSKAAPMEPADVKRVTEPKLGVVETSTDPIAAAAAVQSHSGDTLVKLVNQAGEPVKPSEFFEVPDGPAARSLRQVKHRVSEVFTSWNVRSPQRRLLFTEGQMVPVQQAETLIALHG